MQIEDAFYFLPNPFPAGNIVGVVKQTLGLVDGSSRQVPLSEVHRYLSLSHTMSCSLVWYLSWCLNYGMLSSHDIYCPVKYTSCRVHVSSFFLSKLCLHVISLFLSELASCFWYSLFGCYMQRLEGACMYNPLCFSLQNHCLSLHKDKSHVINESCCCSSICTTSLVPQILWSARARSLEAAMQNHLWLSPFTQLSMAPNLCLTCQGKAFAKGWAPK